jgi:hypothetical protein
MLDIRLPVRTHRTATHGPTVRISPATRERLRAISSATGCSYDAIIFAALAATYDTGPRTPLEAR